MNILAGMHILEKSPSGQKKTKYFRKEQAGEASKKQGKNVQPRGLIPVVPECFDFLRDDRSIFYDFLPVGYITLDEKGVVKTANLTAAEMFGVEKHHLINTEFLNFVHKQDKKILRFDKNTIDSLGTNSFDIRLKNKLDLFWVRVNISFDESLGFYGRQIRLILSDINEFKQIEQENIRFKLELQKKQKMETIGLLSSGIAHDFNNILHPMICSLEMLMEDTGQDAKQQKTIENVLAGANRAGSLVSQILSFSHQADNEICPVKIQPVIQEVLKLTRSTLPANIKIIRTIDNECGPVMVDPTQIHQIAMNLITNAFHAMGHDDGILYVKLKEVNVRGNAPGEMDLNPGVYACLSIADTGEGIDASIRNRIFESYFTTKEKGTGLGLSVISDIVKKYGGNICFSSEIGKGSLFRVYIPLAPEPLGTTHAAHRQKKDLCGCESILFIDDEPFVVSVQQEILERYGYKISAFNSSLDALNEFETRPGFYDIVVCDMAMPGMTGLKLAEKIKELRPDIPFIICTGFSEKINKDNYLDKGVDGFLMKPAIKEEFLQLIRHLLDNR